MKFKRKLFLGLVFILLFFVAGWKFRLLNIKQIEVNNNGASCINQELIKDELELIGENIFLVNEKNVLIKVTSEYPCVKNLNIEKKIPQKVVVNLEGRKALTRIVTYTPTLEVDISEIISSTSALADWSTPSSPSGKLFIIDGEGVVFGESEDYALPMLFIQEENLNLGERLDKAIFANISIIFEKLGKLNLGISEAKLTDNYLLVKTHPQLIFSLRKDILTQLASLQLILQKAKIDGREMKIVDLRFDKPVVTYLPKK